MIEKSPVDILLVDDQPSKLLTYEVILGELGENLIKAGSGREALEYLLRHDIAVMLVDVVMPELDGFELAAMVRAHPRFRNTAIIFVSALAQTVSDRLKGYEQGAVDYLPVPIVPELLRAKVRVFADLFRKTRQLELFNAELERRVAERTNELARANAELEERVEKRTREREHALAQVYKMQKLESLGQLTGGVAHDFNNLLTTMLINLELLSKRHGDDPISRRLMDSAFQSATRGAELVRRMLAFARRQDLVPEIFEVGKLIAGMADMLKTSLGPNIRLGLDLGSDPFFIRADPGQLELAILNLALNAKDAMPRGGELAIELQADRLESDAPRADRAVRIIVRDTGDGMDEATLSRAAEPFFTTKDVGKGTGLGLSMVHGLVSQSNGQIRISSQPGRGTTVELHFVLVEPKEQSEPTPEAKTTSDVEGSKTILIVDDDDLVAESVSKMLTGLGHDIYVANSGARALELVRERDEIELVLTDQAMPEMTGLELAASIHEIKPSLPVVLGTGCAPAPDEHERRLPRLSKPYREADLRRLIASIGSAPDRKPADRPLAFDSPGSARVDDAPQDRRRERRSRQKKN